MNDTSVRRDKNFQAISDWLIEGALSEFDLEATFLDLCRRLRDAGIPLMRGHLATRVLHPMFVSDTTTWEAERDPDTARIQHADNDSEQWQRSPLFMLLQSGELEARHRLAKDGDWQVFPMLVDLEKRGATDYFAHIVLFQQPDIALPRQDGCILTWTSNHPDGFSDEQIAALRWLGSRFGVIAKLNSRERTATNVVSAYLGAEAGRRVLAGQIKLGDGEVIPAVIWYSDLRRSTALADTLSGEAFLAVLNRYFQCTAGSVLDHGGEVLRFIGDAVLAIFSIEGVDGPTRAARVALAAARDAQRRLAAINDVVSDGEPVIDFGLALHRGELMFGNIGVPERIEFSVIGPVANEVARLEDLTKSLGRQILVSKSFAELLPLRWEPMGTHPISGVDKSMTVYAPPAND